MPFPDILAAGCLGAADVLAFILFIDWAAQGVIDSIGHLTRFEDE
jgi:hypothetical protein